MILKHTVGISLTNKKVTVVLVSHSILESKIVTKESWDLGSQNNNISDLAQKINSLISEREKYVSEIYLGVPADKFIVKNISFPSAVKDGLKDALRYEMEKIVPVNPDELVYDFIVVSESGGQINIQLFILKKADFNTYFSFSDAVKGGINGILFTSQAVSRFVSDGLKSRNKQKNLLVIGREGDIYEYALSTETGLQVGTLDKITVLPDDLNHAIIDSMAGTENGNESFLYCYGDIEINGSGILSDITIIEEDPFEKEGIKEEGIFSAYSLACASDENGQSILNFLPESKRRKKDIMPYKVFLALSFILACSVLFTIWAWNHRIGLEIRELDAEIERLKVESSAVEKIRSESERLEEKVKGLSLVFKESHPMIDVLREVTTILPPDAWIKQFNYHAGNIEINGLSSSSSSLIPLFESSGMFEQVKFLSPITKDKDGKDIFRIGMKLETKRPDSNFAEEMKK